MSDPSQPSHSGGPPAIVNNDQTQRSPVTRDEQEAREREERERARREETDRRERQRIDEAQRRAAQSGGPQITAPITLPPATPADIPAPPYVATEAAIDLNLQKTRTVLVQTLADHAARQQARTALVTVLPPNVRLWKPGNVRPLHRPHAP